MSESFKSHVSYRIDEIADRFEAAWQGGECPSVEDYADTIEHQHRVRLLLELVRIDFEYNIRGIPDCSIDEYLKQFPPLNDIDAHRINELVADLRRAQRRNGRHTGAPGNSNDSEYRFVGRFRILKAVGTGSFGAVYRAEDPALQRQVAVKIPRSAAFATEREEERFIQEARSAARLLHTGIVQVHEIGYEGELPFIVTDYVKGPSLAEELRSRRFTCIEAAELMVQAADALAYAHCHGIVHRDVSPSNILLDQHGKPFITDFGLAQVQSPDATVTLQGQILGTPAYMSPEQAAAGPHPVDARSDVYSMGVILYELLTGERPFHGDPRMVLYQVLHAEPTTPRSLDNHIPVDLETICNRAMAKAPQRRYASAADLHNDLQRFLDGRPVLARPIGILERSGRWARRNPVSAALIAAILLLITTAAVVGNVMAVRLATAQADSRRQLSRAQAEAGILELEYGSGIGLMHLLQAYETAADDPVEQHSRLALLSAWHRDLGDQLQLVIGQDASIQSADFSPDGTRIVTAGLDGNINVWDIASGQAVKTLAEHQDETTAQLWSLGFSDDGETLLTGTQLKACVWETSTWTLIRKVDCGASAISPDGRLLAISRQHAQVEVIEIRSGQSVAGPWAVASTRHLKFNTDGGILSAATELGTVHLWDMHTGSAVNENMLHEANQRIESSAFSDDGHYFATGGWDQTVCVWHTIDGKLAGAPLPHDEDVKHLAFSHGGSLLASGSFDGFVRVWHTADLRPATPALWHGDPVLRVAFSPDGRRLASAGMNGNVKIWDLTAGRRLSSFSAHQAQVNSLQFDSQGTHLLTASNDNTARLWQIQTSDAGQKVLQHQGRVWETDMSSDNRFVAGVTESGYLHVWDLQHDEPVADPVFLTENVGENNTVKQSSEILSCRFHPLKNILVTVTSNGRVMLWNVNAGQLSLRKDLQLEIGAVRRIAFSGDGKSIAVASHDLAVMVWDDWMNNEDVNQIPHPDLVWSAAFSADDLLIATGSQDGIVRVFDRNRRTAPVAAMSHDGPVTSVTFSRDGRFLVSASEDHSVRLWNCDSWTALDFPVRSRSQMEFVDVSPDGRLIATASNGGAAHVWDIVTGLPCGQPTRHAMYATSVRFSRDGRYLLSSSFDGTVCVRDLRSPLQQLAPTSLQNELILTLGARLGATGTAQAVTWQEWQAIRSAADRIPR